MGNLLTLSYWFNLSPGPWIPESLRIVYAVFGLLVIFGLIAWLFAGKNKDNKLVQKFWQKLQTACLTIGIIGLVLIVARQQRIYFLSMPFLVVLLLIGALVWAYYIFCYATKTMPTKKAEVAKKKEKDKYLP